MTVVLTLNAEPLWLQAIQQQALPTVATLAELTQTQTPVIVNTPVTLAQLTELIAQHPKVLLAYTAPEQTLAALLTQGLSLTAATAQWQQQVQALLALHRQWRRKLVLVNLSQLSYCHTNDLNILAEAGWPLTKSLVAPTAQFYTVIAAQLLQQQHDLNALYQLLKASSIVITEQLPPCNLDTILQQYQSDLSEKQHLSLQVAVLIEEQAKHLQDQKKIHQALQVENDVIFSELKLLQEQYEKQYRYAEKSKHDAISLDKQTKREITRLKKQLSKAKARAEEAEFKLSNLQQAVNGMQNSKAWKVAAPVRALSRLIHKADKTKKLIQRDVALIITSELFDAEWYTKAYPDVAVSSINPAEHYLRFGAAEGRRPSPDFDGTWYLQRYPDVAETGINPLLHFVKFGRSEGRTASPKLLEDHREQGEE